MVCEHKHKIQLQVLGTVGLAQPGMMLDWPQVDSGTNADKGGEGPGRGSAQPFHLNIFACKLTTQIFFDPFPENWSTFITGITQPGNIILWYFLSFEGK